MTQSAATQQSRQAADKEAIRPFELSIPEEKLNRTTSATGELTRDEILDNITFIG